MAERRQRKAAQVAWHSDLEDSLSTSGQVRLQIRMAMERLADADRRIAEWQRTVEQMTGYPWRRAR